MLRGLQNARGIVTLLRLVNLIRTKYENPALRDFDIEITEGKPTPEQLKSLTKYYDKSTDKPDDVHSTMSAVRPILVDWYHGRVAVNNESEAAKILEELAKRKQSN
ncbi:hypothetical protein TRICI_000319 [Trichomonascus ciferrii]|uniref:Uncharacterized protein n=1 Tax=Trichomonascus ciferrii TaxID=44093 RepID=A0A642VDS9_9ASCO|nr:hypothetical protein TRICI_000319 [Trichomonascus ciferrii]